jgi:hypothetical protein
MVASTAFATRSGWSVCTGIPWSVCPGIGGQLAPESGGLVHQNLQFAQLNGLNPTSKGRIDIEEGARNRSALTLILR